MLEALSFKNVGPAPSLALDFKPRMNFLTGDNGLGKSFILDVAWWALTRTWARELVRPHPAPAEGEIGLRYTRKTGTSFQYDSTYDRETERWSVRAARPAIPGLVLYAHVDGGFSVWDPARNYWRKDQTERPESYIFTADDVWQGNQLCEGLIRDWASWQREGGEAFSMLTAALSTLSPSSQDQLRPGDLKRISLDDPKHYPTLQMPYGQHVPVVQASAGMRRIIALAYLLVWTWRQHLEAAQLRGDSATSDIIFLVDEIEAHLHPQWQRRIVPSLLEVMEAVTGEHQAAVQLITVTHSPLVLASSEPHFDSDRDGLFHFRLNPQREVELGEIAWAKQGDVLNWLVSDAFGLKQGRSREAETAIEAAEAWMRGDLDNLPESLTNDEKIHEELLRLLPGHDPFWPRWVVAREKSR